MGVTVQRMVDADVSGVLFTCNPVSGDPSTVAINASWGLGLAVVGGEVTPDEYLVSKVTGEVRTTVGDKHVEYRGRGRRVPVDDGAPRGRRAWTTRRSRALVELAKRVQTHFGSHQDVEWAFAGRRAVRAAVAAGHGQAAKRSRPWATRCRWSWGSSA